MQGSRVRVIDAKGDSLTSGLKELFSYRYLISLFMKRDFTAIYKQTILGPFWFVLNPLLLSLVFTIVFQFIAESQSDGIPHFLFFFSGLICWSYFSSVLERTARTFTDNAAVFGKVYFPRLTVPISSMITGSVSFGAQFVFLLVLLLIRFVTGEAVPIGWTTILAPLFAVQTALLALGIGLVVASLSTKFKDLVYFLPFAIQLWMYMTPIFYSLKMIPERLRFLFYLNPMTAIVLNFRYFIFGNGIFDWRGQIISVIITVLVLVVGYFLFNHAQKNSMDTV